MSQHDFNIANQLFPATRADLNNSLVALASNSSGDAEPTTTYANQWWYETDSNTLKLRNEANNAWVPICILDQGNNNVLSITTQGLTLGATTITASGTEINQLDAITRGSLIYGNASGVTSRLAKGAADTVLTSDGTDISWAAAGGGGTAFVSSSGAISNAANVTFTGFDASKYDHYIFYMQYVTPATDNTTFTCQVSTDGGSNYDSNSSNYNYGIATASTGFTIARDVGSAANEYGISGPFSIFGPHLAKYTMARSGIVYTTQYDTNTIRIPFFSTAHEQAGLHKVAADVDAVRFQFSSGNIESGEITMVGITNS